MATTYCTITHVADFLRIPIDKNSVPNTDQVEKLINRNEDKIERRTGHAWRSRTITNEVHHLPLIYTFGWGTPIYLQHRNIKTIDSAQGDKIEVWNGSLYEDITSTTSGFNLEPFYGVLHLRGYLFSILRDRRIRVSYRFGDTTVPGDIEEACIKLTAIDIVGASFRMDTLPMGSHGISPTDAMARWKEDVDRIIRNREEIFIIP